VCPHALQFQQLPMGRLEVAMGLETVHPEVLPRLNKRMTLDMFSEAAEFLRNHQIDLRSFVLIKPPFVSEDEAVMWAQKSTVFALDSGSTVVSLIPVRSGNGALDALDFVPPKLRSLETALADGIRLNRGRVFADLWDLQSFSECEICFEERRARLSRMNLSQALEPAIECNACPPTST